MPSLRLVTQAPSPGPPLVDEALWRDRLMPVVRALIRLGYFKLSIDGAEHLPRAGRLVLAQNHAGWFPLDAIFLAVAVREALGPAATPVFATHEAALALPVVGALLRRGGAVPASWFRRPERLPPEVRVCGIFPEGVAGNTKPFWHAYRMRNWNRGFVRVAAALGAPVVPTAVLGGEECLPVAWTVKLLEPLVGSVFGLPLSLVPLPSRWRMVFHPPIDVGDAHRALTDGAWSAAMAEHVRGIVQDTLDREATGYPLARVSSCVESLRHRWTALRESSLSSIGSAWPPATRGFASPHA